MSDEGSHVFSDLALSRRLERAEMLGNARFVEARARVSPESGAAWVEVAGAYAMFDGVESPITQSFGLGLFQSATPADLGRLEEFFHTRGAHAFHEVSPLAETALPALLNERGYRPVEFTNVLFRPLNARSLSDARRDPAAPRVRLVEEGEHGLWAQTSARGWADDGYGDFMLGLAHVGTKRADSFSFLAELDGLPVATGAMSIGEGVALFAGASTVPEARGRGAQTSLLDARLRHAAEHGCDLAMMCALPGTPSQRNAERKGFRIAYTRVKWRLARPAARADAPS